MNAELELQRGWVGQLLAEEFPQLALFYTTLAARSTRSPPAVRERLRLMSDRFTGAKAVNLRQQPIPWAYRVFFRHIGIDPDDRRTPPEAFALERMRAGAFESRNLLDDAMLIATVETGVALVAFDAARVDPPLGLRLSEEGELLGGDGRTLAAGQLVIADAERALGVLFGELAEGRGVHPRTERILLGALRVKGVPDVSVEEALWAAAEVLTGE